MKQEMKLKRLDNIINNNITFSTNKNEMQQAVYILQDISETLAMIYDKLCETEELDGDLGING